MTTHFQNARSAIAGVRDEFLAGCVIVSTQYEEDLNLSMGETNQTSQYLHNVHRVLELASNNPIDMSVLEAAYDLAEAFLVLEPYTASQVERCDLVFPFFLQTLWCNPNNEGIEQAIREFKRDFGEASSESSDVKVQILTGLRNVLCTAKLVPSIREDLRDPSNISNLITASLNYEMFDSGNNWYEQEELDCLKIFVGGAWEANDENKRQIIANELQFHIESSSIEPPESTFEALYNGRFTIPNDLWD
jgi:hypothetical protein